MTSKTLFTYLQITFFGRPEVTNVADIIKIATMLKKKLLDNQQQSKQLEKMYLNAMLFLFVYPDIIKLKECIM